MYVRVEIERKIISRIVYEDLRMLHRGPSVDSSVQSTASKGLFGLPAVLFLLEERHLCVSDMRTLPQYP